MPMSIVGLATAWCASCQLADRAPTVTVAPPKEASATVTEGCVRFALRVSGGVATVDTLNNTPNCPIENPRLIPDSAAIYEAATGTLRVPVRLKNVSATTIGAPVRVRYNADSAQYVNAQCHVISGKPNVLAVNYDSANAGGRIGVWRFDQALAPAGSPQVLAPGQLSQRKWLEFNGDWPQTVRIRLPIGATVIQNTVPAVAPDTIPAALISSLPILTDSLGSKCGVSSLSCSSAKPHPNLNDKHRLTRSAEL